MAAATPVYSPVRPQLWAWPPSSYGTYLRTYAGLLLLLDHTVHEGDEFVRLRLRLRLRVRMWGAWPSACAAAAARGAAARARRRAAA